MTGETTNLTGPSKLFVFFCFLCSVYNLYRANKLIKNFVVCDKQYHNHFTQLLTCDSLPFWPCVLSSIHVRAIRSFERRHLVMGPAALLLRLLLTSYATTLGGMVVCHLGK